MAKAVLVMDMPESCDMCDFVDDKQPPRYGEKTLYCGVPGIGEDVTDYIECRPESCPLRELPEKRENDSFLKEAVKNNFFDGTDSDTAYFNGKDAGWNACLDKILKTD